METTIVAILSCIFSVLGLPRHSAGEDALTLFIIVTKRRIIHNNNYYFNIQLLYVEIIIIIIINIIIMLSHIMIAIPGPFMVHQVTLPLAAWIGY